GAGTPRSAPHLRGVRAARSALRTGRDGGPAPVGPLRGAGVAAALLHLEPLRLPRLFAQPGLVPGPGLGGAATDPRCRRVRDHLRLPLPLQRARHRQPCGVHRHRDVHVLAVPDLGHVGAELDTGQSAADPVPQVPARGRAAVDGDDRDGHVRPDPGGDDGGDDGDGAAAGHGCRGAHLSWLLLPVAAVLLTVFCSGLGLFLARGGARAPDIANAMPFILTLGRYASGAMFLITAMVPDGLWFKPILIHQPVAIYLELFRAVFGNEELIPMTPLLWLEAIGWAVVVFAIGFLYFWRAEETYGRD